MEKIIDRKEYRREEFKSDIFEENQINLLQKKIRKFLFQSLGASLILVIVSFFRFFNCEKILSQFEKLLIHPISVSELQKSGQKIFEGATKYYIQLEKWVAFVLKENSDAENIFKDIKVFESEIVKGNISLESGEQVKEVQNKISGEQEAIVAYEEAVEGLNQMFDDSKRIKEKYKLIVPTIGTITSEFGVRNSSNPKVSNYHSGLDIAANTGTQILAALEGEVIEAGNDTYFGKYIKIKKEDIVILYAHCSKLLVKKGDKIQKGNLIAYVGNTGNSTGSHLHLEIRYQDRLINPKDVLEI